MTKLNQEKQIKKSIKQAYGILFHTISFIEPDIFGYRKLE